MVYWKITYLGRTNTITNVTVENVNTTTYNPLDFDPSDGVLTLGDDDNTFNEAKETIAVQQQVTLNANGVFVYRLSITNCTVNNSNTDDSNSSTCSITYPSDVYILIDVSDIDTQDETSTTTIISATVTTPITSSDESGGPEDDTDNGLQLKGLQEIFMFPVLGLLFFVMFC